MEKDTKMESIRANFFEARRVLDLFLNDSHVWEMFSGAGNLMVKRLSEGNKIIACGNGGSMCDAMHFAEELSGRFRNDRPPLAAISISDPTHITCVANDYGFDQIFSRYVEAVGRKGDLLLAISTSGDSPNVVAAAISAKKLGMSIVALTGKGGGKLAELADFEIRAPKSDFSDRVQEIHIKVIHSLVQYVEEGLFR
ncbi:MAG: D-sedoheptulose 7-phosphate isomerase [Bacteroidales bacterium]